MNVFASASYSLRVWKDYQLPKVVWLNVDNLSIFFSQFYRISYSSFSQCFGSLHQINIVGSFHFSFSLSLFFFSFLFHLPFLPHQLPSFIILVSISSPFCSSGRIAYFVSYCSHLLSPFPSTLFLKLFHFLSLLLLVQLNASSFLIPHLSFLLLLSR